MADGIIELRRLPIEPRRLPGLYARHLARVRRVGSQNARVPENKDLSVRGVVKYFLIESPKTRLRVINERRDSKIIGILAVRNDETCEHYRGKLDIVAAHRQGHQSYRAIR